LLFEVTAFAAGSQALETNRRSSTMRARAATADQDGIKATATVDQDSIKTINRRAVGPRAIDPRAMRSACDAIRVRSGADPDAHRAAAPASSRAGALPDAKGYSS
jgi:hypothetical protein